MSLASVFFTECEEPACILQIHPDVSGVRFETMILSHQVVSCKLSLLPEKCCAFFQNDMHGKPRGAADPSSRVPEAAAADATATAQPVSHVELEYANAVSRASPSSTDTQGPDPPINQRPTPYLAEAGEAHRDQRMLQRVTRELVTCYQDLDSFGLHLGLPYKEIDRARNNNPNNIEGAALRLACIWWDQSEESREEKLKVLLLRSIFCTLSVSCVFVSDNS